MRIQHGFQCEIILSKGDSRKFLPNVASRLEFWNLVIFVSSIPKKYTSPRVSSGMCGGTTKKFEYKPNTNKFKFLTMISAMKILVTLMSFSCIRVETQTWLRVWRNSDDRGGWWPAEGWSSKITFFDRTQTPTCM